MDKDIEIKILEQQIRNLKNKLFESTIIQPRDYRENLEYPKETFGTKAAREIRAVCNKLTDEERKIYFNKALDIIYKDYPEQDPRKKINDFI